LTELKAYVPYDGKEVHVESNIEILVAHKGAIVEWVKEKGGKVPVGAVGPMGDDCYVGRAVCPHPESKWNPGKIVPKFGKMYICWGGKEIENHDYEALVIRH